MLGPLLLTTPPKLGSRRPKDLLEQATAIIRRYRPDLVMSVDPGADYVRWHKTDHRMAAFLAGECAVDLFPLPLVGLPFDPGADGVTVLRAGQLEE